MSVKKSRDIFLLLIGAIGFFLFSATAANAFFFVVKVSPEVAQEGVDIEATVSVTFNKPLDRTAMDGKLYLMQGAEMVPGALEFDYSTNSLHFIPQRGRHLVYGATYTAVLTSDIRSVEMETLGSEKRWSFTTEVAVGMLKDFYPFPNPAEGINVNIHYLLAEDMEEVFLEIFDVRRRRLSQFPMPANGGFNNTVLQLVDDDGMELPWGLYHLRLRARTRSGAEIRSLSRLVKGR
ncbi:MAG: hypothetical protein CVV64_01685 [Candidatus Wallbacteria bacterium HGW-Wallbacteria-1]|jgi:hypothetical protein|uniref:SbsA Ig-like domain-containing protein n=1 Tax=Candidatus Wallbacteria bacterium HGW-Wallbacteria-1 TaxID=2013854 RepID=A0A2N1PUY4_9BACT|nr:MAG: hypothetical protein CVV64_01685 [Candidatus Wallbacteria bacterium HGW-Wallbacteria-1]